MNTIERFGLFIEQIDHSKNNLFYSVPRQFGVTTLIKYYLAKDPSALVITTNMKSSLVKHIYEKHYSKVCLYDKKRMENFLRGRSFSTIFIEGTDIPLLTEITEKVKEYTKPNSKIVVFNQTNSIL